MDLPLCGYCTALLPRMDQRFCSIAHRNASRRVPIATCQQCQRTFAPPRRAYRFCSVKCSRASRFPRGMGLTSHDILEILAVQGSWWMTSSDLAILIVGEDTLLARHRISTQIGRLKRRGFVIESRPVIWEPLMANANNRAYRLVAAAARREGRGGRRNDPRLHAPARHSNYASVGSPVDAAGL